MEYFKIAGLAMAFVIANIAGRILKIFQDWIYHQAIIGWIQPTKNGLNGE